MAWKEIWDKKEADFAGIDADNERGIFRAKEK